nr:hypothetical protein [Bacteroidota bacterium]
MPNVYNYLISKAFIIIVLLFANSSLNGQSACTMSDGRIFLERLPIWNFPIFLVKVLETEIEPTRNISKVQILETFFGDIDTNIISFISGGPSRYKYEPTSSLPPNIILLLRTNCNPNKNTKVEDIQYGMDYFDSSANKMFELNAIRKFSTARKLKRKRPFEIFYTNGNLGAKGAFKNGKPIGMWQFFFDNGKIKTVNIYDKKARLTSKNTSYEYGYQDTVPSKLIISNIKKGNMMEAHNLKETPRITFSKMSLRNIKKEPHLTVHQHRIFRMDSWNQNRSKLCKIVIGQSTLPWSLPKIIIPMEK